MIYSRHFKRLTVCLFFVLMGYFLMSGMVFAEKKLVTLERIAPSTATCFCIMFGKDTTVDGSVISAQSEESGDCEIRLRLVPAANHKPGEKRVVQLWNVWDKRVNRNLGFPVRSGLTMEIPQVEHTYAYIESTLQIMNEHQVAIAEAGLGGARKELDPSKDAKLKVTDTSRIALERATTAREYIKTMAMLMEEHGFTTWHSGNGESLAVSDKNEVWVFEFLPVGADWKKGSGEPGVLWCAMRIPDDKVAVNANQSIIGEINLKDPDNFMASSNVKSLAIKHGWWNPKSGKPFRWDLAYFGKKANGPRTWRALSMLAPSQNLKPNEKEYPNPIKPDKKFSILDIREFYSDHFEGTEFDQTKGLAAGPYGSPDRPRGFPNWIHNLSLIYVDTIHIHQSRNWLPDPIGGVTWVGMSAGDSNVFVPFYVGVNQLPKAYTTGSRTKFSWDSAFWTFSLVSNWARLNYCHMIKEIKKVQHALENAELNRQAGIDEEAWEIYQESPALARVFLTDYCIENANNVLDTWRELASFLIARYNPGGAFEIEYFDPTDWWREEVMKKQK